MPVLLWMKMSCIFPLAMLGACNALYEYWENKILLEAPCRYTTLEITCTSNKFRAVSRYIVLYIMLAVSGIS